MRGNRVDRHQVMTISGVPYSVLDNGTASIFKVASPDRSRSTLATIGRQGFVRTLTERREYVPREYDVMERDDGMWVVAE